jgi:glycine/D-amino acid oxidase-like deaminating enzyme
MKVADVLVVGAGAAGVLSAAQLRAAGYSVVVVDADGIGAHQSNHSHGYLHRGHIYGSPSAQLVRELNRGSSRWASLLAQAGVEPVTARSCIGFGNRYTAAHAVRRWREAGLAVVPASVPPPFRSRELPVAFETDEPAYDFTDWLHHAKRTLLEDVRLVPGRVRRLTARHRTVGAAEVVLRDGTVVELEASAFVVAAGTGSIDLISSVASARGRGVNRTSFMLVLRGELPTVSMIVPDHESYGLFLVSRRAGDDGVWLVSNYLSFAGTATSSAATSLWVRAVARTLARLTSIPLSELSWAFYAAPKSELRPDRQVMSEHSVEDYGFRNCFVASPSKLTLAPLLADKVVTEVKLRCRPRGAGNPSGIPDGNLAVYRERWRGCALYEGPALERFLRDPGWTVDDVEAGASSPVVDLRTVDVARWEGARPVRMDAR